MTIPSWAMQAEVDSRRERVLRHHALPHPVGAVRTSKGSVRRAARQAAVDGRC